MKYILASASPRRQELLHHITDFFTVIPSDAEETVPSTLHPEQAPEYLAALKAASVAAVHPDALVIGADTGVFIDGEMLGKPKNNDDAHQMLTRLSGRTHKVITGCALYLNGRHVSFSEVTEVTFYPLSDAEINAYIQTGETGDKAGSYGIQQKGCLLVQKIMGDYFNVVGLPVARLSREIRLFLNLFDNL